MTAHLRPADQADAAQALAAEAMHAYCAAWLDPDHTNFNEVIRLRDAMMEVHLATTPARTPASHVLVKRAKLERLQAIASAAVELLDAPIPNPPSASELVALAAPLRLAVRGTA